jgi:cobalt-zinc-cadmium efflux system outer membrane protein
MSLLSVYECMQHAWRLLAVTGVLVMYSLTASAAAEGITIEEAVRLALHDNPALQAQQQMTTAAEGELRQARTFPHNPRLEWEGLTGHERNATRQKARKFTTKLSQELPLGGKWHQRIQIAAAGLDRTQWDVQNAQRELVQEVKETFYRLLFLEDKRTFADQAVALAQRLADIADERYRAGDSPQLEVNLARVEVHNVRRQRLEVLSQLTQARLTLNRLLGRPVDAPLAVSGTLDAPSPPLDLEPLRQQALQQRPDLRSRTAAIDAARAEVALARAQRVPDVEVAFVFEREEISEDIRQTFGGSVAVPLPLWNRHTGAIAAAQARTRAAALERTTLQHVVATEVATTIAELQRLRASLQLFQDTILPQSRANLDLLHQAFAAGEMGIGPLITEQRAFIDRQHDYLATRFAYRTSLVALESSVGGGIP